MRVFGVFLSLNGLLFILCEREKFYYFLYTEVLNMRKNLTEIVFILDRSGSMSGLEADTIGGFNSMIEKQKKRMVRH